MWRWRLSRHFCKRGVEKYTRDVSETVVSTRWERTGKRSGVLGWSREGSGCRELFALWDGRSWKDSVGPQARTNGGVDGRSQPSDDLHSALIPLVGLQALPTLLKAIAYRKDAYSNLIVHSPKRSRRTQGELMDVTNPPICQQIQNL